MVYEQVLHQAKQRIEVDEHGGPFQHYECIALFKSQKHPFRWAPYTVLMLFSMGLHLLIFRGLLPFCEVESCTVYTSAHCAILCRLCYFLL